MVKELELNFIDKEITHLNSNDNSGIKRSSLYGFIEPLSFLN